MTETYRGYVPPNLDYSVPLPEKPGVAPRARPGQEVPTPPPGHVATRLDGGIVFIPARTCNDSDYKKSPYTSRQVAALQAIRSERKRNRDASR